VTFDRTADPWVITNSTGLSFTGATTTDAVSADASAGPAFPADARLTFAAGTLTWPAASDDTAVSGYQVVRDGVVVATVDGTSYAVTGLAPDLRYRFAVRAVDATGNASRDLTTSVRTAGAPDTVAPTVTGTPSVAPGSAGCTWARLTWPAAADDHGVDHYDIAANGKGIGRTDATSFVATGLTAGTTYAFTVTAVDASGNATTYPGTATATTLPPYDTGAPAWPMPHPRLKVRQVTATSITVAWPAARDDTAVTGYRVLVDGRPVGPGEFTPIDTTATTADTSYPITGLTPRTRYTIAVEAGDAAGRWSGPHPAAVVSTARR
jgi:exo-poly-alpha-galacturonosidase